MESHFQKWKFWHDLFNHMSFQTCMIYFLLWIVKEDILKNGS